MDIVFRTDASLKIGTGHVMRCLTLAHALRERGAVCRFVCREHPGHLLELINEHAFEALLLPNQGEDPQQVSQSKDAPLDYATWLGASWESDAAATQKLLGENSVDWIIVDNYALDARWEKALRPHCCKIMVIDDLADRHHDCDLLLDQNLVADMVDRYDDKLPAHCGKMLGPEYALLQPLYSELHARTPPREGSVQRVLVYFGGADAGNLTGLAIAAFLSLKRSDIALDVVINPNGPHRETIRRQIDGHQNIALHTGLPSLAPLMVKADLAIGGAGATSWERCCLGLPTLVITLAENQKPIAAELHRQALIRWLGHQNEVNEAGLAQVLREVVDDGLTSSWSESCQRVVDGRGTDSVARILLLDAQVPLRARLARLDDEVLLLDWANDALVRQSEFTADTIDLDTHRVKFRKCLRDLEHCRMFVVETDDGLPVGHVSFEQSGDSWKVNYGLDSRARGNKLDDALLATAMLALRANTSGALLFVSVNNVNEASRRLSETTGVESVSRAEGQLSIAICSDSGSWINESVPGLVLGWLADGHSVAWAHAASDLPGGDVCFYLSYGRIVDAPTRSRYRHNLVVHASDLPKGRGWSPASWLILDSADRIPVTLLEADNEVDAGPIYLQEWLDLDGTELIDNWRAMLAEATVKLSRAFVIAFPDVLDQARDQAGEPTTYSRRRPDDSALDQNKALSTQFNQLRVADNDRYPAFFVHKGKEFILKIFAR